MVEVRVTVVGLVVEVMVIVMGGVTVRVKEVTVEVKVKVRLREVKAYAMCVSGGRSATTRPTIQQRSKAQSMPAIASTHSGN